VAFRALLVTQNLNRGVIVTVNIPDADRLIVRARYTNTREFKVKNNIVHSVVVTAESFDWCRVRRSDIEKSDQCVVTASNKSLRVMGIPHAPED
jgi:hypothetical protein